MVCTLWAGVLWYQMPQPSLLFELWLFSARIWNSDYKGPWKSGVNELTLDTETVERPVFVSVISLVAGHRPGTGLGSVSASREEEGAISQLAS